MPGFCGSVDATLIIGGQALAWVFATSGMLGIGASLDPDVDPAYFAFWIAMSSIWLAVGHALIVGDRSAVAVRSVEAD